MKNSAEKTAIKEWETKLADSQTAATVKKVKRNIVFYFCGDSFDNWNFTLSLPKDAYDQVVEIKRSNEKWQGFQMDIWHGLNVYPAEQIFLSN
ncbi:MAG: hypothetical protein ACD_3C00143G0005 [uncultured bacterium (gcode 4)]|uniref:Uncharacterized protein n=1 Tax=uncultured bacterium (gcode 4) TaxID=1234023 RepID=K2FXX9_9BACT|nr:MAG: hypothetical protein ACD_3C00143G0005 [uncultured bacterium (gcode 4)]